MAKHKILIVDDVVMNRVILKELLLGSASKIYEAEDGLEAIEIITSNKIDIIFMDIEMPKMNGLETAIHIRHNLPSPLCNIPIIALTAHNPNDFFDDFASVGFNQLLTKPYSFIKINNALKFVKQIQ